MTPPVAAAGWGSRAVPVTMTAERLAALVQRSLDRTEGMLFTATPREELDAIGGWQRLKDLAFAGQMREIVASYNRAAAGERGFVGDEVGLAVGAAPMTGANLVGQALALAELPGLLEAVEAGVLTERHVLAVLRELAPVALSTEQRQALVQVLLARYTGQTPGETARLVARLVLLIDRAAALAREQRATTGRRVGFGRGVEGQASVWATGPAAQIAAIRASLEATLDPQPEPADERSTDARRFDLLVDLLTGSQTPSGWTASIVVPYRTAAGGELELAELPGLGPVLPSTAQQLLGQCHSLSQVAVDTHGQVLAVGDPIPGPAATPSPEAASAATAFVLQRLLTQPLHPPAPTRAYRVPTRLSRYLKARDRCCVFPGCHRLAVDLDHRIPWPTGATDAANLQCLCRHHHRAKQAAFTVTLTPDGHHAWTTRGGWVFLRRRQGY
jgi:hypothetical protein